jgi:uncharacterized protein YbcI
MQVEGEEAPRGDDAEIGGPAADHARVLRNISRAIVELYKVQFGRGPETVSSRFAGPDTLITLLGNTLTPVERTMRDMGEEQRLRDIRMMFQYATEEKFRAIVEEMTGRQVVAFISGIDVLRDVSCEVFTLLPASEAP